MPLACSDSPVTFTNASLIELVFFSSVAIALDVLMVRRYVNTANRALMSIPAENNNWEISFTLMAHLSLALAAFLYPG